MTRTQREQIATVVRILLRHGVAVKHDHLVWHLSSVSPHKVLDELDRYFRIVTATAVNSRDEMERIEREQASFYRGIAPSVKRKMGK